MVTGQTPPDGGAPPRRAGPETAPLTCHGELGEGHPLQQRAQQLAGRVLQAQEERDGLAVVELRQAAVLLPQVLAAHLSPSNNSQKTSLTLQLANCGQFVGNLREKICILRLLFLKILGTN